MLHYVDGRMFGWIGFSFGRNLVDDCNLWLLEF
jgi:hypothetical protein